MKPKLFCPCFGYAGRCDRKVETFENACALRPRIFAFYAAYIVRRNAPLLVCGPRKRDIAFFFRYKIRCLNGVADGINIFVARLHMLVYDYRAAFINGQVRFFRKLALGPHSYREYDHVALKAAFSE
ncbi:MAG: hypothetical protein BWY11_00214 [Firmicutes bacterium ADurb.Bin182]|nr:MAG: hypothetical protein BWY11_00214 [Firmicutes bacterium ADurb.Bin182]